MGDELVGYLHFTRKNGVVVLDSTHVDESARGHGIAGQLAKTTLGTFLGENQPVCATCPYIVKWLESHPGYEAILVPSS